jgi:uncharacterized BrkB/YihY/UPF0761 family membrane protein
MDNKKLDTVLTIIAFIIGVVGIILGILIMIQPKEEYYDQAFQSLVGGTIQFTNILLIVAAAAAILFGLYYFATNIKKNIPLLIGVLVFVVIAIVSYSLAGDAVPSTYADDITPTTSRLSGAGLGVMYVLVIVAILAALIGEISRIFK